MYPALFILVHLYQTVRASDSLTGTSMEALVNIALNDVNDNPPLLERDVFTVSISEEVAVESHQCQGHGQGLTKFGQFQDSIQVTKG